MTVPAPALAPDDWPTEEPRPAAFTAAPPHNNDAEMAVLGGMMLANTAIDQVLDTKLRAEDFYRPVHTWICQALLTLYGSGEPADPITVGRELEKRGLLAKCGGPSYLHTLVQRVPTAATAVSYAEIVVEKATLRRLRDVATRIIQDTDSGEGEVAHILDSAGSAILGVTQDRTDDTMLPLDDGWDEMIDRVDRAGRRTPGQLSGIPTGFRDLDALTDGLLPGQMVTIAGRPGQGKTTLATDIARTCAIKHKLPVIFFSLEMGRTEVQQRVLSAEGRIALQHLRTGAMTEDDWGRAARFSPACRRSPFYIDDSPELTMLEIRTRSRRQKMSPEGLGAIIIDYLQLLRYGAGKPESRHNEVQEISRSIKLLAKELQVPVIALSQLNRGPEQRADKRPVLSDLRESGAVEQDSDIVVLVHREDAYDKESPRAGEADLIVAKHRGGATATITVASQLHYSRFVDMAAS